MLAATAATAATEAMSIGVCVRMDELAVAFFTLALPFLTLAFSYIVRVDSHLRKEMETLETLESTYYNDDM